MNVSIVGPVKQNASEGKTNPKIFIYKQAFETIGYSVKLFSTTMSKIHVFKLLKNLKQALKFGDTVVLMFGGNACRQLVKFVLFLNKKYKKRIVLAPFGTGPLNPILNNKDNEFVNKFINNLDFSGMKDKKMAKQLKRLDLVVVQNDTLARCFTSFYGLDNVFVLPNIRFSSNNQNNEYKCDGESINVVFISRVVEEKGILDLMDVVNAINKEQHSNKVKLNIYGEKHLNDNQESIFNGYLNDNVSYYGPIPNKEADEVLKKNTIACLPTKYVGEGTPGFLIEALIAGVPLVTSSFTQVNDIIKDGVDSLIFKIGDKDDLKSKLLLLLNNRDMLLELHKNAIQSGKRFAFENNIDTIQKMIEGN